MELGRNRTRFGPTPTYYVAQDTSELIVILSIGMATPLIGVRTRSNSKKASWMENFFFTRFWPIYLESMLNFQNPGLFLLGDNEKLCKNRSEGEHVQNTIFSKKS